MALNTSMNDTTHEIPSVSETARLFDAMAGTYDKITDLWYSHLFATIEKILVSHLTSTSRVTGRRALDVGCGTGIQTQILERIGYETCSIDISSGLLNVTRRKIPSAHLFFGDAQALPFVSNSFDVINCCGSTLSFVPDYAHALSEMVRVVRRKGKLFLEVEQKWNLDLFWCFLNAISFNVFGYDQSLSTWWRHVNRPLATGFRTEYPFPMPDGSTEYMKIRLFTLSELHEMLKELGVKIEKVWGIHIVTNTLPSTLLHQPNPNNLLKATFHLLERADNAVRHLRPFRSLGCSIVVLGTKVR